MVYNYPSRVLNSITVPPASPGYSFLAYLSLGGEAEIPAAVSPGEEERRRLGLG